MEEDQKQEPESHDKKKKKEKAPGSLSLPLIIGAAAGMLLLVVASVIVGIIIYSKFLNPQPAGEEGKDKKGKVEKKASEHEDPYAEEGGSLSKMEGVLYMETGRITTNPKDAPSFIVINLAFEFKPIVPADENKELKKMLDKEGRVNLEEPMIKKMMARIRGHINQTLASYTQAELQTNRPKMAEILKTQLKPMFKDYEFILGNISILEFIVQD